MPRRDYHVGIRLPLHSPHLPLLLLTLQQSSSSSLNTHHYTSYLLGLDSHWQAMQGSRPAGKDASLKSNLWSLSIFGKAVAPTVGTGWRALCRWAVMHADNRSVRKIRLPMV